MLGGKHRHYFNNFRGRRSIRLKDYDYSQVGIYFVTICTRDRECLFGEIINEEMYLNDLGRITQRCWEEIIIHYPKAELDEYIIMPNHLHGIIFIIDDSVGVQNIEPLRQNRYQVGVQNIEPLRQNRYQHIIPGSVGAIIRGFKIGVKKNCGQTVWQRNYYDHIIRNENSLEEIRNYIYSNPGGWTSDIENSAVNKNMTEWQRENYYKHIF